MYSDSVPIKSHQPIIIPGENIPRLVCDRVGVLWRCFVVGELESTSTVQQNRSAIRILKGAAFFFFILFLYKESVGNQSTKSQEVVLLLFKF